MRTATVSALAGACLLQAVCASAADLDYGTLRGSDYEPAPVPTIDWSGFYAGGHGGWSSTAHGLSKGLSPLLAQQLYQLEVENEFGVSKLLRPDASRTTGSSFGGFLGYNAVVDDFVFGVEGDYTHIDQTGASGDAIGRAFTTSAGNFNNVLLSGTSRTSLIDYGTVRGRVGYALGSLLPFATAGLAFGHARISDEVTSQNYGYNTASLNTLLAGTPTSVYNFGYSKFDPLKGIYVPAPAVALARTSQKYVAGFAAGFGLDFALTSNIVLRGEYQYILFEKFGSHNANVNTVRGAAAVKF